MKRPVIGLAVMCPCLSSKRTPQAALWPSPAITRSVSKATCWLKSHIWLQTMLGKPVSIVRRRLLGRVVRTRQALKGLNGISSHRYFALAAPTRSILTAERLCGDSMAVRALVTATSMMPLATRSRS